MRKPKSPRPRKASQSERLAAAYLLGYAQGKRESGIVVNVAAGRTYSTAAEIARAMHEPLLRRPFCAMPPRLSFTPYDDSVS